MRNNKTTEERQIKRPDETPTMEEVFDYLQEGLSPPFPRNEPERLRVLHALHLDELRDISCFRKITLDVSVRLQLPIALVSLVEKDRQFFLGATGVSLTETHRDCALCAYTIQTEDVLVIANTLTDARSRRNALVTGETSLRFYAGAPLRVDGFRVGSLCVLDTRPHDDFHSSQKVILRGYADECERHLEERRRALLTASPMPSPDTLMRFP